MVRVRYTLDYHRDHPRHDSFTRQEDTWKRIRDTFLQHVDHHLMSCFEEAGRSTVTRRTTEPMTFSMFENEFVSPEIQRDVRNSQYIHSYLYTHRLSSSASHDGVSPSAYTILLDWYSPNRVLSVGDRGLIQRILASLMTVALFYRSPRCKFIRIYMCPTEFKKTRDPRRDGFDPQQVNSGVTTMYKYVDDKDYIVIYRREECERVAIHELLHFIHFDFYRDDSWYCHPDQPSTRHRLCDLLPIRSNYVLGEVVADSVALLWNAILSCIYTDIKDPKAILDVLHAEYDYVLSVRDTKSVYCEFQKGTASHQTTGAYSYYVLKGLVLEHLQEYHDRIYPFTHRNVLLTHRWTDERIDAFLDWMYTLYTRYTQRMTCSSPSTHRLSSDREYSLRMSHLEIHEVVLQK